MKQILILQIIIILAGYITPVSAQSENPNIFYDGGRIPDSLFRTYVLKEFDTDRNGTISKMEAEAVTEIELPMKWDDSLNGKSFTSLDGIQYFPNLRKLICAGNSISTIDLSQNKKLEELDCCANNLTQLDLSQNKKLTKLTTGASDEAGFAEDNLKQIIFPQGGILEEIECGGHKLTTLDLSGQTHLIKVTCSLCPKLTLVDLSGCRKLEKIWCCFNEKLSNIDLSYLSSLKLLHCYGNKLKSLNISNCPQLAELDVSNNSLSELNLSNNQQLRNLHCGFNQISKLDISTCQEISEAICMMNPISDFNFSGTKLEELYINVDNVSRWSYTGATEPKVVMNYDENQKSREFKNLLESLKIKTREINSTKAKQNAARYKQQITPYLVRKDWKLADELAAKAITELSEGDAFLYLVRAKCYFKQNLDFEVDENENMTEYFRAYRSEAEYLAKLCRKSIEYDSSNSNEAYFYRGMASIVLGHADDAADDFKRYAQGNESLKAICYYNAGIAYKNAGRYSRALELFKISRQHYTSTSQKEQCLARIKECQKKLNEK